MLFTVETVTEYYWDQMQGQWMLLPQSSNADADTSLTSSRSFEDTAVMELNELARVVQGHDVKESGKEEAEAKADSGSDSAKDSFHGNAKSEKQSLTSVIYHMSHKAAKYLNCRRIGPLRLQEFFEERFANQAGVLKLKDVLPLTR